MEDALPLADLRASGRIAVALRWTRGPGRNGEAARAVAALCAAHPGPAPVVVEWSEDGTGRDLVRLRSRTFNVALDEDLLAALRDVLGREAVTLVKAG